MSDEELAMLGVNDYVSAYVPSWEHYDEALLLAHLLDLQAADALLESIEGESDG